jgi:hypothetical protein
MVNFLLLDETFPPYEIAGCMGLKQSGKTLYAFEQGYAVTKEVGGNILYISTENLSPFLLDVWRPVFESKYNTKPKLVYRYLGNVEELLAFCGAKGQLIYKGTKEEVAKKAKGIKIEWNPTSYDEPEETELAKLIKSENISYLVIDSITEVFSKLVVAGQQNYPLRDTLQDIFFASLREIIRVAGVAVNKPIYIFTTHHITMNPIAPQVSTYHMVEYIYKVEGGKSVGHHVQILYAFEQRDRPHGARIIWLVRYANVAEFSKSYSMMIDKKGWARVTKADYEKIKEEQKAVKGQEGNEQPAE